MTFSNKNKLFLLALPAFYLLIAGVYLIHWIPFFTGNPDPVYAYLFNGMTLATGKMEVGHTDHPGTPVQCFAAIVIFIKHLFNHSIPLYQDVILHPESYLRAICTAISLVFAFTTWYTGHYLLKRTGNIFLALVFQLTHHFLVPTLCMRKTRSPNHFLLLPVCLSLHIYIINRSTKKRIL
jgi:hypothetical protein